MNHIIAVMAITYQTKFGIGVFPIFKTLPPISSVYPESSPEID